MTSLSAASLIVGTLISVGNTPGMVAPDRFAVWLKAFPRNRQIGVALMILNTIWAGSIVFTGQYSDFWIFPEHVIRVSVFFLAPLFCFAVIQYADQYLAARGAGILLILAARPLLAAAFVEDSAARLVITILAYIWVIAGIVFVAAPHRLRDMIDWGTSTVERVRLLCMIRFVFGMVLILLGIAVY